MMIGISLPEDRCYDHISAFARTTYERALGAMIDALPDVFAYSAVQGRVCGCFGLYRARAAPLLIERYIPDAFEKISGKRTVGRACCAELGTRAIAKEAKCQSANLSLALSASLILYAHREGLRHLAFTSTRAARGIAKTLGIALVDLGAPDTSAMDEAFRRNWHAFFHLPQRCFGFRIDSIEGCVTTLALLQSYHGYSFDLSASAPC